MPPPDAPTTSPRAPSRASGRATTARRGTPCRRGSRRCGARRGACVRGVVHRPHPLLNEGFAHVRTPGRRMCRPPIGACADRNSNEEEHEHPRPPLHRRARGAARIGPRLHRARARPPRPAVGGGALVPRRRLSEAGRAGPARAEVPRGVRRAGRRLPARGGALRGDGAHGSGGTAAGIGAHINIATPPIWKFGTEEQKQRYLVPSIAGELIGALGITEPGAGSDVAGLSTRAERVDGGFVVNGEKTYITNGVRADFIVTAVKTTPEGGHHGISFLIVDRGEGVTSSKLAEARLARLRHGHDRLPGRVRARGEPARRAARGLQADHGQLPVGAPGDGARRGRRDAPRLGAHRGVRARAQHLRAPALRPSGDPPQARRHGHLGPRVPLRHLRRAAPVRRRRGPAEGGHDGQARDPARGLRADGRLPADPRRRGLHARVLGRARRARRPPRPDRRRQRRDHARDPRAGAGAGSPPQIRTTNRRWPPPRGEPTGASHVRDLDPPSDR